VREGHRPAQVFRPDEHIEARTLEEREASLAEAVSRRRFVSPSFVGHDVERGCGLLQIACDRLPALEGRGVFITEYMPVKPEPLPLAGGRVESGGIDLPSLLGEGPALASVQLIATTAAGVENLEVGRWHAPGPPERS
jgi:hypothetical protein